MFTKVDTTLPADATSIPDIDPAVLDAIDSYADGAGYGYSRCLVDDARIGCQMEDSKWFRIPEGKSFSMRHYEGNPRHSVAGTGAFVEVVDMDGSGYTADSFLRIYSVVDGDKGYTLSDT